MSELVVGSENIPFYIREQSKQTIEKGTYYDRHVYSPKGKLSFVLDSYPSRAWHDGKEQRLESLLGEIVIGTFQFAEVLRAHRPEGEEWHRRWEEEKRLRELQEEAPKKGRGESTRVSCGGRAMASLQNDARIHRRARAVLESSSLDPGLKERAQEWIAWARQYADGIDPLKKGFEIREIRESNILQAQAFR